MHHARRQHALRQTICITLSRRHKTLCEFRATPFLFNFIITSDSSSSLVCARHNVASAVVEAVINIYVDDEAMLFCRGIQEATRYRQGADSGFPKPSNLRGGVGKTVLRARWRHGANIGRAIPGREARAKEGLPLGSHKERHEGPRASLGSPCEVLLARSSQGGPVSALVSSEASEHLEMLVEHLESSDQPKIEAATPRPRFLSIAPGPSARRTLISLLHRLRESRQSVPSIRTFARSYFLGGIISLRLSRIIEPPKSLVRLMQRIKTLSRG